MRIGVSVILAVMMTLVSSALVRADDKSAFDKQFIHDVYQYSRAEGDLSSLAKQKSQRDGVKEFADSMKDIDVKISTELKSIAKKNDYKLDNDLSDKQKAMKDRLEKLKGDEFDLAYVDNEVDQQKEISEMFDKASSQCKDKQLQQFADDHKAAVADHYQAARALFGRLHNDVKAARNH